MTKITTKTYAYCIFLHTSLNVTQSTTPVPPGEAVHLHPWAARTRTECMQPPRQVKTQHKTQQPVCRSLGTSNDNTCFKWPAWSRRTFNSKPTRRTGTYYKKLQHPILQKVIHSKKHDTSEIGDVFAVFCCCCISSPTMLLSFPLPGSRESPLNLSPRRGATKRVET